MEFVWPALSYRAWHFVAIHDPIRESHVIQPSTDALLIAAQTEGRWPRVRVAFEVDKLDRSFRNRVQELTQQQVPTVVNRIQLIAFSDFSDLCDPTRNERCFHCYMYLNGVALMDEDMQAVREGDHLLLRIIPRADLPAAYFAAIPVSATGFDEQNFPRRVVHNSLVPTVAPWSIPHNVALDTYCISLWTNHGGAVLQQRWFTVWRVRSIIYHRVPSMRVRRVHPQDAWVMIDKIHSQWPDLQPREWSLMQVHGSYLLSPFLARHAQLVILQTPLDTPHNFATVVLHRENTDAWAGAIPRRVPVLLALQTPYHPPGSRAMVFLSNRVGGYMMPFMATFSPCCQKFPLELALCRGFLSGLSINHPAAPEVQSLIEIVGPLVTTEVTVAQEPVRAQ